MHLELDLTVIHILNVVFLSVAVTVTFHFSLFNCHNICHKSV